MLNSGLQSIPAIELLKMYVNGKILPYTKNRGGNSKQVSTVKVSTKTREGVYGELVPDALGTITIGKLTSKEADSKYFIIDGHSRLSGLIKRYQDEDFPAEDFRFNIDIKVIETSNKNYLRLVYEKLNDQSAHSSNNKLTNDEYEMGFLSQSLLSKVGITQKANTFEFEKARLTFCSILCYLSEIDENLSERVSYPQAYKVRSRVTKLYNRMLGQKNPHKVKLSDETKERILGALNYYLEVKQAFWSNVPVFEDGTYEGHDFYSIFNTVGCFGSIVCDHINNPNNRAITNVKPETLGKRIFDNSKSLYEKFSKTTNGSEEARIDTFNEIVSKLTKSVKRKKIASAM